MFGRATIRLGIGPHSSLGLAFCVFFWLSMDYFVLILLAFVALGLVFSVLCQELGYDECLQNDLFCVEWDVKP